ncbi:MAG TPA: hypothetical protein V6C97_33730 [Oculatellaceae cyanobacterium]
MSKYDEKKWTASRIIAVGLFTLCVGALIHQGTGGATLTIVGTIIAFFLAGAISDPNASKGAVALRSTTRDSSGPMYGYAVVRVDNGSGLRRRQIQGSRRCGCQCGCRYCS